MTIIVTDAKDPLRLTESELTKWQFRYEQTFRMYYGKPPSLEKYIRQQMGFRDNELSKIADNYSTIRTPNDHT